MKYYVRTTGERVLDSSYNQIKKIRIKLSYLLNYRYIQ